MYCISIGVRMSGGNKFKDLPENQMTTFYAEFPRFMQNSGREALTIGVWYQNWGVRGVKISLVLAGVRG